MVFPQRLVVRVVAEGIEHGPHLDTLLALLPEEIEEQRGNTVVAEVEVLQVHALPGLADGFEHIVELLLP